MPKPLPLVQTINCMRSVTAQAVLLRPDSGTTIDFIGQIQYFGLPFISTSFPLHAISQGKVALDGQ